MKYIPLALVTILASATAPNVEARVVLSSSAISAVTVPATSGAVIVQIKGDKGKGGGHKKNKKGPKEKPGHAKEDNKKHDKIHTEVKRSNKDRLRDSGAILRVRAPEGRDMSVLLGALPLALLGSGVLVTDVPADRLLTYRNCPPGLAKKDPPCVPPGLAKKGVTYEEWVTYDEDRLDEIYLDQRRGYVDRDVLLDNDDLLLNSNQIASLFGLRAAPAGERYALIDGQPVLLTAEDNTSLLMIRDLARAQALPAGLRIAPTAALTQDELRQTYQLPALEPGYNYAVVNGELVTLQDKAYETLQLVRIARAFF